MISKLSLYFIVNEVCLTFNSIISWFYILDIEFGNGLGNRFTETVVRGEKELAKKYVSTLCAILFLIIIFFYVVFILRPGNLTKNV